jgi:predicted DNA-binding transcriptional regulator AlpA
MTENKRLIDLTQLELVQLITETFKSEFKKINDVIKLNPRENEPEKDLLNREETSKLLKISFTTLWKHSKSGILPCKKLGNKVYYFKQDIDNLLNRVAS